jgi:hypothetical protein
VKNAECIGWIWYGLYLLWVRFVHGTEKNTNVNLSLGQPECQSKYLPCLTHRGDIQSFVFHWKKRYEMECQKRTFESFRNISRGIEDTSGLRYS